MKSRKRNSLVTTSIVVVIMLISASTASLAPTDNAFAYSRNQAKSAVNECSNGSFPTNIGCQNTDYQIQGDGNAEELTSQQTFPDVTPISPAPPVVTSVTVSKEVICPDGFVCPTPSDFSIHVDGNGPVPASFDGSAAGTVVSLGAGPYSVTEQPKPISTPGLIAKDPVFSQDCSGDIPTGVAVL